MKGSVGFFYVSRFITHALDAALGFGEELRGDGGADLVFEGDDAAVQDDGVGRGFTPYELKLLGSVHRGRQAKAQSPKSKV